MNSNEHERNLIVALLRDKQSLKYLRPHLKPEYFDSPLFSRVCSKLINFVDHDIDTEVVTVTNAGDLTDTEKQGLWDNYLDPTIGGHAPTLFHHVLNAYISRRTGRFISSINLNAFDAFEHVTNLSAHLTEIENTLSAHTVKDKGSILDEFRTHLDESARGDKLLITTPWSLLTRALNGGMSAGDYILIGGTAGSGKTSFMLAMALHAAEQEIPVGFIEGEMSQNQILERWAGISTGRNIDDIKSGQATHEMQVFLQKMRSLSLNLHASYENNFDSLKRTVLRSINDGAKLIFVDYLQKYAPATASRDEFALIKHVSGWLRSVALKYNVVIVVASSLNRTEQRDTKLSLASFYGSSGLGHDCSTAILLSSDDASDHDEAYTGIRVLTASIVKNRSGIRGDFQLNFNLRNQRIL